MHHGCGAEATDLVHRRMKQQMLDGQDTDDDKLAWRVEAELKLRLDELRRTEVAASAALAAQLETAQVCLQPAPECLCRQ